MASDNKGNSGNTNGGTQTSFTNTPQAKDDLLGAAASGIIQYVDSVYILNVMGNDLGGNGKSLWSVDDGVNQSGAMSGHEAGDLLTQDPAGVTGADNVSQFGARLSVTADGRVAYDTSTIAAEHAADLVALPMGGTLTDSFIYAIRLGNGTLSWARANVVLTGVNDTPVVQAVAVGAVEDGGPVQGAFVGDDVDSDDDGTTLQYSVTAQPAVGALTNNNDGTFAYDPGSNFQELAKGETLQQSFTYTATDKHGAVSAPATVTITVTGTNDGPVAVEDTADTDADTVVTIDALGNDSDVDASDVLTITSAASGSGGTVSIVGNQLEFDPRGAFNHLIKGELEDVTLTYSISDGNGGTATSTVVVTVEGTNTPPEAVTDTANILENNDVTLNVLANDVDPDPGEVLKVVGAVQTEGAGVSTFTDTTVSWRPLAWYYLLDPNSAAGQDLPLVSENDRVDGKQYEFAYFDYDHLAAGESATIKVAYTVEDRFAASDTGEVLITVTGVNDAPLANIDNGTTDEDGALGLEVLANDTDIDASDVLSLDTASIVSGKGSVTIVEDSLLVWNPGKDYDHLSAGESATVVIDYSMSDGNGGSSKSQASITVLGTNDAPVAFDDTGSTTENANLTLDVLANDTDVDANDGKTLQSVVATAGAASIVGNKLAWSPGTAFDYLAAGESQDVTVTYSMSDKQGAVSSAKASITVNGVNDLPVANADAHATGENAPPLVLNVLGNDTDKDLNDTLVLDSVAFAPGKGTASIVDNHLVWTQGAQFDYLAAGESSTVTGSYIVKDGKGGSATGQVQIVVAGVNDAPLAVADKAQTDAATAITIDVLANDSDRDDSDVLTVTAAGSTGAGTVTLVGNKVQFDPTGAFDHLTRGQTEAVTLVYTIADGNGGEDTNAVTVTVVGDNTLPQAIDENATTTEDVNKVVIDVLANDVDPDGGEVLKVTKASLLGGSGTVSIENNSVAWQGGGAYQYLAQGESATVTVQYTMQDSQGASDTATVNLKVAGTNDVPTFAAANSKGSVTELYEVKNSSQLHTASQSINFSEIDLSDGHSVAVTPIGSGYLGTLTATITNSATGDGAGTVRWDYSVADKDLDFLRLGQVKEQTYSVSVNDGNGGIATHDVTISLNGNFDTGDLADGNATAPVAVDNTLFSVNYNTTGFSYNAGNGHYYKYVAGNYDWYQARAAADAAGGYLVTVTNAQENSFVSNLAPGTIWMGGSDLGTEGKWIWTDGPEAGTQFWSGGTNGSGAYQNWPTALQPVTTYYEPNNSGNEDYLEFWGWEGGAWNDNENAGDGGTGYIVEIDGPLYEWDWTDTSSNHNVFSSDYDPYWYYETNLYTPDGWHFNSANGHYYKYVTPNTSWSSALTSAAAESVSSTTPGSGRILTWVWNEPQSTPSNFSVNGHLATITSQQENDFIKSIVGNGRAWIGASDADSEGTWKWVAGPENGTTFWIGDQSGAAPSGRFENWSSTTTDATVRTEPNNILGTEDFLSMWDNGTWNDLPYNLTAKNFVIEIGGRAGDPDQPPLNVPNEDETVTIDGNLLLVNDYDVDGDTLTITSVSPTTARGAALTLTGGNVVFNPLSAFQYLKEGETTTDTFNYTISDGGGGFDSAQVTVTVRGLNDAPVALNDSGATKQESALFLNVLTNDSDVDGNALTLTSGTKLSSKGAEVVHYTNGDVRYGASSAALTKLGQGQTTTDTFTYTVNDGFKGADTGTVSVVVTGINDRPVAVADTFSVNEETKLTGNVFNNDFDHDNGDSISMVTVGNFTSVKGAAVTIDSSGNFTYVGPHNFSGKDSFNYTIKDSFGLTQTGTATVNVLGIADAPTVAIATSSAGKYNEVTLQVTAGLTDTTESGSFVFTGVPAGVTILNQQNQNVTNSAVSFFGGSQTQTFKLVLPTNQDVDFDIGVTATSREQDTGSAASTLSNTKNVEMNVGSSVQNVNFSAVDQNMWTSGDAYMFTNVTNVPLLSINTGSKIVDTSFSIPLAGTFDIDLGYDLNLNAGLRSTLHLDAGSVDADVPYKFDIKTAYNVSSDVLHISTGSQGLNNPNGSQQGGFSTIGPNGYYKLELVFDGNAGVDLDIDNKVWVDEWSWSDTFIPYPYISGGHYNYTSLIDWHPNVDLDSTYELVYFDQDDLAGNIPLGPLSDFLELSIAWPSLTTTSTSGSGNVFTSSGKSNDVVKLTLDVDQTAAYAVNAALGNTDPRLTVNPFNLTFSESYGPASVSVGLELLDFDVFGAANFLQNFRLEFEGFSTFLKFENASTMPVNLGGAIDLPNASQYDSNNDGNIDISLLLMPNANLTNDTDLGFDLGYFLGLVKPHFDVSLFGADVFSLTPDNFLYELTDRVQVATIDIFKETFDFSFEQKLIGIPIDETGVA